MSQAIASPGGKGMPPGYYVDPTTQEIVAPGGERLQQDRLSAAGTACEHLHISQLKQRAANRAAAELAASAKAKEHMNRLEFFDFAQAQFPALVQMFRDWQLVKEQFAAFAGTYKDTST